MRVHNYTTYTNYTTYKNNSACYMIITKLFFIIILAHNHTCYTHNTSGLKQVDFQCIATEYSN